MNNAKRARKVERKVVSGYKKIEDTVVSSYEKVENAFVSGYKKIEDKFVETFLDEDPRGEKPNTEGE
jgi:hypothetical protein